MSGPRPATRWSSSGGRTSGRGCGAEGPCVRRICILFDIDGTLLHSDGAGGAAMARAFEASTGRAWPAGRVPFQGRTERWIVSQAAVEVGIPDPRTTAFEGYEALIREELAAREPYALPGAEQLLSALAGRRDVVMALATGNMRVGAFAKLEAVGLAGVFEGGGFGDEHADRVAMTREAAASLSPQPGDRLVTVGDTEHDIAAAHAIDSFAVGVATGPSSVEELIALGADVALPDFSDLERSLEALLSDAAG